ncbi:MAG: hypothetical protein AVDCRST_MAG89-772, partial [uncultured Gemmatimonadetes bacterium]
CSDIAHPPSGCSPETRGRTRAEALPPSPNQQREPGPDLSPPSRTPESTTTPRTPDLSRTAAVPDAGWGATHGARHAAANVGTAGLTRRRGGEQRGSHRATEERHGELHSFPSVALWLCVMLFSLSSLRVSALPR